MVIPFRYAIAGLLCVLSGGFEQLMAADCQEVSYETVEGGNMQTKDCEDRDPSRGSLVPLLSCLPARKPQTGAWGGSGLNTVSKVALPDGKVETLMKGLQWTSSLGTSQTEIYYELLQRKETKKEGGSDIELQLKEVFTLDYREDKVQRLPPSSSEPQTLIIKLQASAQGFTPLSVVTAQGLTYTCAQGRVHDRLLNL
ncbi:MAG: hypothetical protein ACOVS5_04350 [Oligoflexus sp.]|jgi:hypothetical protein